MHPLENSTRQERLQELSRLCLAVFRTNGLLLRAGDALTAPLGLSSARWQVLGALALASVPLSVPRIAEAMGLTRQGVQKQINALTDSGHVEKNLNPSRRGSPLHRLTIKGQETYAAVETRYGAWAARITAGMGEERLGEASRVLETLLERLEGDALPGGVNPSRPWSGESGEASPDEARQSEDGLA
ncbi:hypothetical protein NNJEOMEG_01949 [Fundidesulfovibrio magnetotacticus]|uniref:HTH marR-type domain-containing protein n=1 Tax=Fundidesulfovibrio magnetotacticus TaxID=2730080 RepID=A0A6V8LT24_9BACT|nr:MarR family winged helix-turn-helix transcriptional regulator [Fundidesulfovibrio magnetotacticus]GFK94110.1 hypothetical protein NNJEOMEG_01949 [Fundidesulfovibrio magnetotacticus]